MLEPDRVAYSFTLPHELPEMEFKGLGRIFTCCFGNTRSLYFFFRSIQTLNQLTTLPHPGRSRPENSKVGLSGFFLTLNPLQNQGNNDTFAAGRLKSGTFPSRF